LPVPSQEKDRGAKNTSDPMKKKSRVSPNKITGWLQIDGKNVSSQIQTPFKMCSDIFPMREDDASRFYYAMAQNGLHMEARFILNKSNR
jgi:hypothetical protein